MTHFRLRDLREAHDLKQKDIAQALNIPAHTYSNYEKEIRALPYDILINLARYYNTSADYILGLTDVKRPYPRENKGRKSSGGNMFGRGQNGV